MGISDTSPSRRLRATHRDILVTHGIGLDVGDEEEGDDSRDDREARANPEDALRLNQISQTDIRTGRAVAVQTHRVASVGARATEVVDDVREGVGANERANCRGS